MIRTFELFREGEWAGDFDRFEEAHREAMCSSRPWQIWVRERAAIPVAPRKIAEGDGAWKCTHYVVFPILRAALYDAPVKIGETRTAVYATPEGRLFTEGAWNRGGPPDFLNTGIGVTRGHGGIALVDAVIVPKE